MSLLSLSTVKVIALVFLAKAEHNLLQFVEINEQNIILFLGGLGMREIHKSVRIELLYRTIGTVLDPPPR